MPGLSLGLGLGLSRRLAGEIGPWLSLLHSSASTVAEDAETGTTIGTVIGKTKDSTLELTGDADGLLALDGVTLKTADALDYETAATLAWEITETLEGAGNSGRVSDGVVTVTNVLEVELGALSLDDLTCSTTDTQGTKVGTITGGSAGSTITLLSQSAVNAFAKDGEDIELGSAAPLAAGSPTITLEETHPDASNSGRQSVITITVEAGAAAALIARMSAAPDATRQGHIADLIDALQAGGVWTKLDALYVMAAHDAQAAGLNWKAATYDLTVQGTPTFTTDEGYAGTLNSAADYLDSGFNPSTASGLYAQNSCHVGVFVRGTGTSGNFDLGTAASRTAHWETNRFESFMQDLDDGPSIHPVGTAPCYLAWSRTGASTCNSYRNTSETAGLGPGSNALSNANMYICRYNGGNSSGRQLSLAHWGSQLSGAEVTAAYNAFNTYLTAVGAV